MLTNAAPLYTTVIQSFLSDVLQPILNAYVYNGYATLTSHLELPLGMAVMLSLCLMGISISQGWVQLSIDNFVKWATKVGFIYLFAMNWAVFSFYIVEGIQNAAGQIGDWLLEATPLSVPHFAGSGINGALQSVLIEITNVGGWVWDSGNLHHGSPWLVAVLIYGFGYAMVLFAFFEIVLAKLMLAILFTLAPLFISFTLFQPTLPFFDRWLGMIASFAFLLILISATLALALNFAAWVFNPAYANHAVEVHLTTFVPMVLVCFLGIGLIFKVSQLAHHLGGAVCTGSASAMLAGAVGGAVGGTMAGLGLGVNAVCGTIRADKFIKQRFMGIKRD